MFLKRRKRELPDRSNNIWNRYDFAMCGLGERFVWWAKIKHVRRCLKWSRQRIVRGYADIDVWKMYRYLQTLIPDMLQNLRDNHYGSPGFLGEDYVNDEGFLVNDTCHEEWEKILDQMVFLWRETREETCSRKNPYKEEYFKARGEFSKKYGDFGEKLQTKKELEATHKRGIGGPTHFMDELPQYKEISDQYFEEELRLEQYRNQCKDEALEMLKTYFFSLWD